MTTKDAGHLNSSQGEPFNPLLPEFRADPYPIYHQFRARNPVHCATAPTSTHAGFWYLFRHADVAATLKGSRFGRELHRVLPPEAFPPLPESHKPFYEMAGKWMLYCDPPDHTRLRALVNKAFTPKMVERLRPRLTALADDLLDEVSATARWISSLTSRFRFP